MGTYRKAKVLSTDQLHSIILGCDDADTKAQVSVID